MTESTPPTTTPTNPGPPVGLAATISLTVKAVIVCLVSLEVIALSADQQSTLVMAISAVVDLGVYLALYFGVRHRGLGEPPLA